MQVRGPGGARNEWNCLFEDASAAWLAEDKGGYVLEFPAAFGWPDPGYLRVGATTALGGRSYQVICSERVALAAAEGELPRLPPLDTPFGRVELRSADNEMLAIDYGTDPPVLTRGRPVALQELQFAGLKAGSTQAAQGRSFACPHCGAPVAVQLDESRAITCPSCDALIDLSSGVGGELRHALQDEPIAPLIPLGSIGRLKGLAWQVLGFQHRLGTAPEEPDEHFGWDEYLLYNRERGFRLLLDATEGWSLVKPAAGAPTVSRDLQFADYLGTSYLLRCACQAQTSYVAGEFYQPLERGQTRFRREYASGSSVLCMEETPGERSWSLGSTLAGDEVARAFGLEGKKGLLERGEGWLRRLLS
jgi:hypothetical protein